MGQERSPFLWVFVTVKKGESMFKKAERKRSKIRLALCGPSGSGKTYSALFIAKGLGEKIAVMDTENGSGELYAHLFDYDVASLQPPFTPGRYVELIKGAERGGYDVVIIDSLSHAWAGTGGVLDMKDMAAKASKSGNSFAAWRDVTPEHNRLVDAIISSSIHVIVTMRTKTAWEIIDDGTGKKKPVKIGLAPVQRDGLEYEFTTILDLSSEHVASCTKDRTSLFDGRFFVPSEDTGKELLGWFTEPGLSGCEHGEMEELSDAETSQTVNDSTQVDEHPRTDGSNGQKPSEAGNGNGKTAMSGNGNGSGHKAELPVEVLLESLNRVPVTRSSLETWWYDNKTSKDSLQKNEKSRVVKEVNRLKKMAA